MKRLQPLIIALLLSVPSFGSDMFSLEVDAGFSSPGKGFVGARFWPMQTFSAGVILGTIPTFGYADLALAYSYHFFGYTGIYAFQSIHWLGSGESNIFGIDTGLGYQHLFFSNFLIYAEIGVPIYIGNGGVYYDYKGGVPRNEILYYKDNGDLQDYQDDVFFTIRTGFGVGYMFGL